MYEVIVRYRCQPGSSGRRDPVEIRGTAQRQYLVMNELDYSHTGIVPGTIACPQIDIVSGKIYRIRFDTKVEPQVWVDQCKPGQLGFQPSFGYGRNGGYY